MNTRWLTMFIVCGCFSATQATLGQRPETKINVTVRAQGATLPIRSNIQCSLCSPVQKSYPTNAQGRTTLTIIDCDPSLDVDLTVRPVENFQYAPKEIGLPCQTHDALIPLRRNVGR